MDLELSYVEFIYSALLFLNGGHSCRGPEMHQCISSLVICLQCFEPPAEKQHAMPTNSHALDTDSFAVHFCATHDLFVHVTLGLRLRVRLRSKVCAAKRIRTEQATLNVAGDGCALATGIGKQVENA